MGSRPGELLDPVEAVGHGVAVGVDGRRRRVHVAVLLEVGLEGPDEVRAVLVVVAHERGDGVLVEGADLLGMGGQHAEQQPVGARADVLQRVAAVVPASRARLAQDVQDELGLLHRPASSPGSV
jgi:hypothetical protein